MFVGVSVYVCVCVYVRVCVCVWVCVCVCVCVGLCELPTNKSQKVKKSNRDSNRVRRMALTKTESQAPPLMEALDPKFPQIEARHFFSAL